MKETEATLRETCTFLNINHEDFPEDILSTRANKTSIPKNSALQVRRNSLFRKFGNVHYNDRLPYKHPKVNRSIPLYSRVLNRIHSKINPHLEIRPPKINPETKSFLDEYFFRELQGIDELVDQNVLSKWFPNA